MSPRYIHVVIGSRPEAIKMAPVVKVLRSQPRDFQVTLCSTGQHQQLIPEALSEFDLVPDVDLGVMQPNQTLAGLTARLIACLDASISRAKPEWILVQGDTTSAMVGALAGFYRRIRVGHVEAGMRTSNRFSPYPEEINRRIITQCADVHFAATAKCRQNLVDEGISPSSIFVTGNTVIDALLWIRDQVRRQPSRLPEEWLDQLSGRRLILVTGHRRESFGPGLEAICLAIKDLIARNEDIVVVYPVHPNPNVQEPVRRILAGQSRLIICKPFPYRLQVEMMDRAYLILTDSGGIQEEAPSLGKPVIVMREVTERIEGVEAGNAILVGTDRQCIVSTTETLLADRVLYKKMAQVKNPYGDGHAANRIVEILSRYN